jgi:hypothetical protein
MSDSGLQEFWIDREFYSAWEEVFEFKEDITTKGSTRKKGRNTKRVFLL